MSKAFWEVPGFNLIAYLSESMSVMDSEQKEKVSSILKRIEDGEKNGFSLRCEMKLMGYKPKFSSEVYSFESFAYSTTRNGDALNIAIYFLARDTGKKDKDGMNILEADDGNIFVVEREAGSPAHFGSLSFRKPNF